MRVQVANRNLRVPDVTIRDRRLAIEQIITHAPIAVFEVLSPEDSLSKMMVKLAEYEQMGIQTIVVIDPESGQHKRYHSGRLEPLPAEAFDLPGSACRFDLKEIEKLLD